MSLAIQIDDVSRVLLADGWHVVADKSFDVDAYEFMHDTVMVGANIGSGATWTERRGKKGVTMCCPLAAILAVECK